ncbi:hypothetical protein AGMMS49992_20460 [Clostridia bacterium]|nr:hypothetical protein AGMMS49992_20460 [Clostridia bacterium]
MRKLNVAILGQGRSGRDIHGAHIKTDDRFQVVAVVDPLKERRDRAAQEYGISAVYENYTQLFGRTDIDFVVNSTPTFLHYPIAIDLMKHGFNVLQEKPIAATSEQVKELNKTIDETGAKFCIFLQSRFRSQFVKIREIASSGVLGRLVCVKITTNGFSRRWDWQTLQENVAGSLYNTGPHPLGQALEFLDYYDSMPNVYSYFDRAVTYGDAEDFVKVILTAPSRPLVEVEISSTDAYVPYTFHVQGTCGTLSANNAAIQWKYYKPSEAPEQRLILTPICDEQGYPAYCREPLQWYEERIDNSNIVDNVFANDTRRLYDDVYAYICDGKPMDVRFEQVAQQIAVMELCHKQNPLSRMEV